ncbi:MAG: hypothetical protein IKC16_04200 [Clostridia bacterium]|nr:hypothetical protein [Clostridia bacterium]
MQNSKKHEENGAMNEKFEQLTIDASNLESKAEENILNSTNNLPEKGSKSTGKTCKDELVENAKTPDPVSEFGTFNVESTTENTISDEDDSLLFSKLFPGVSRESVENDEVFKLFSKSRLKNAPFSVIYSDFRALVDKISQSEREKLAFSAKVANSSPGALASSATDDSFFTKEQVLRMSKEQIARNYQKIRQSQERW